MPTNQFVPVATGSGANVRTYSQWAGTAVQVTGVQTGIVASKDMNTAWRQGTTMASVLGQMIVNRVGIDATDDGNVPGLLANVERGIAAMIDPSRYAEDSGAVNTLVASLSPAPVGLTPFLSIRVRVQFANTSTTPTLNLNGFGPLTVVRQDGSPLAVGDLQGNRIVNFIYDRVANVWRIGGPAASDLLGATYITTAITKTVGGSGADFANLQAAFNWLSNYRITMAGSVTFQLAAQQFVYNTSVSFYHPDGARVFVQGATLKAAQTAPTALTYSGNSASARASDKTANLATLRAVYATEIVLQGGAQISGSGFLGNFQDILVSSDGTGTASCLAWLTGLLTLTRSAFVGASGAGVNLGGAYCLFGGIVYALGNGGNGASAALGGQIALATGSTLCAGGNGMAGIQSFGGEIANYDGGSGTVYTRANGGDGVFLVQAGISVPSTAVFAQNGGNGVNASYNSQARLAGTNAFSNGAAGYLAANVSFIDAQNSQGGSNGTFGYYAINGSNIARTGGTATGATAAASPAVGSGPGNNGSYIQ